MCILIRSNKQIWRLAEWLHNNVVVFIDVDWIDTRVPYRNNLYDKAVNLLKKINNNEFTGEDNHTG